MNQRREEHALKRLNADNVIESKRGPALREEAYVWLRVAAVIIGLAALVAIGLFGSWNRTESPANAPVGRRIMRVAPQVEGRVLDVLVSDDQPVRAGDLLVEIDPSSLSLKLVQAMASEYEALARLEQAQSLFALAKTSLDLSELHVAVARNQVARAATERTAAQLTLAGIEEAAAVAQVNLAGSQIRIAEAGVISAAASVEQARLDLSYAQVRAPRAGRVKTKRVEPGDHVRVGQEVITIISTFGAGSSTEVGSRAHGARDLRSDTLQPDARRTGWKRL